MAFLLGAKMKKIIIHCSDTPTGRDHNAEDIHRWHLERGWSGIGYHYVIKINGAIEAGRPHYWQGSHAYGHNKNTIGICLIGRDTFTADQMSSLEGLVRSLRDEYPKANVIGHNEVSKKQCPNFNVQDWVRKVGIA